ncbi:predicted protein [Micromonas commoda]|uniref:Uncharacterized protein n=1 Tax=Micromonas commoda (strain RCC299 / NOUM17 / CCMP2709) TaxID=296587 RepID=C1EDF7_MICCC|nr:predicted protein [Micromonas commoda]ACO66357.1 predicted protein [Micromonas commoda]|eukprot:XP_002505099.1 predicted protein [Micromonas commoda]
MLPLAPVCFPLTCPPVAPRGVGATCADADETASLRRLEHELEVQVRQRSLIRKALADVTPMGQKTTRGVVGNDMVTDEVDNAMDDVDSEPDDDRDFE